MGNIKEFAKAYEPQQMKNIADLGVVKTDMEITEETRKNRDDEEYHVKFVVVDGEEYRVPITVVEQLKGILEAKPDLVTFRVVKTGTGMGTKYQVIALD